MNVTLYSLRSVASLYIEGEQVRQVIPFIDVMFDIQIIKAFRCIFVLGINLLNADSDADRPDHQIHQAYSLIQQGCGHLQDFLLTYVPTWREYSQPSRN